MNKIKLICPIDDFISKHITRDANIIVGSKLNAELATLFKQSIIRQYIILDDDDYPIQVYCVSDKVIEQFNELNGCWFRFAYTNILYDASIKLELEYK